MMIETVNSYGVRRSRQAASTLYKFIFDDKKNIEHNLNLDTSSSTKEVCWIDQSTKKYSLYRKNWVNEKKRLCNRLIAKVHVCQGNFLTSFIVNK